MQSLTKRSVLQARPVAFSRPKCIVRANPTTNGVATKEIIDQIDKQKFEELVRRFKNADTDGNGAIDRDELRNVLESTDGGDAVMFTEHWLPEEELDAVLEKYDTDKNGVIDFNEFKQIVYDGLLLDGKLSEYEEAFRAVDSSGNGTVGATELAQLFNNLGNAMSYEKLVDLMQMYDKDHSGQIEFNEFLLMFRDQLLDLQAIKAYIGATPKERAAGPPKMLEPPEGDIALIFSEKELDEVLHDAAAAGKVAVLFNALTWCRPCKGMQRPAQRMAEAYKDSTVWVKLFGNANDQTKAMFKDRLKIRSTPCFIAFHGKDVVYTQTGTNKEKLEAGLREALEKVPSAKVPADWVYPPANTTA